MTGRLVFFVWLLILFCFTGVSPACALEIYWRPAGDENAYYTQKQYSTTNRVDIQVRVENAKEVEINNEEAIQIGGSGSEMWLLRDYLLKPGNNTIRVDVEKYRFSSDEDSKETGRLDINVMESPLAGSTRYIENLNNGVTAFNQAVNLKLPGGTIILYNDQAAWDQGITVKSTELAFKLSPRYVPLSPVYSLLSASPSHTLSGTGELTLTYDSGGTNGELVTVLYALPNLLQPQALQG